MVNILINRENIVILNINKFKIYTIDADVIVKKNWEKKN